MAADLVVREWGWSVGGVSDALAEEHNALARAYLAMTAELQAYRDGESDVYALRIALVEMKAEQAKDQEIIRGYVLMIEDYEARSSAATVQLAARTAEREHWFEKCQALIAQLEASEAVREAEGQK